MEIVVSSVGSPPLGDLVRSTYQGKTVLVTGHNGFVGSWLSHWLLRAGAVVVGLSLPTVPGGIAAATDLDGLVQGREVDVRDLTDVRDTV